MLNCTRQPDVHTVCHQLDHAKYTNMPRQLINQSAHETKLMVIFYFACGCKFFQLREGGKEIVGA